MPTLYVIAGPNGVGKTTFVDRHLPDTIRELEFVNVDLIAQGLSRYAPGLASVRAGRFALQRIQQLIRERRSFTWETTMSGRTAVEWLKFAKQSGYLINCYFLWPRDLEITRRRIRQRVAEGGHNIESDILHRRFFRTIQNFFTIYRPLCDSWRFFEFDDQTPRLLAVEKTGRRAVRDQRTLDTILSGGRSGSLKTTFEHLDESTMDLDDLQAERDAQMAAVDAILRARRYGTSYVIKVNNKVKEIPPSKTAPYEARLLASVNRLNRRIAALQPNQTKRRGSGFAHPLPKRRRKAAN